jgi:hypothetical protein
MRATYFKHMHESTLPPIQITIVAGENDVAIRISDQGRILIILDTVKSHFRFKEEDFVIVKIR